MIYTILKFIELAFQRYITRVNRTSNEKVMLVTKSVRAEETVKREKIAIWAENVPIDRQKSRKFINDEFLMRFGPLDHI